MFPCIAINEKAKIIEGRKYLLSVGNQSSNGLKRRGSVGVVARKRRVETVSVTKGYITCHQHWRWQILKLDCVVI